MLMIVPDLGSVLTIVGVPVFYAIFFNLKKSEE